MSCPGTERPKPTLPKLYAPEKDSTELTKSQIWSHLIRSKYDLKSPRESGQALQDLSAASTCNLFYNWKSMSFTVHLPTIWA